jgi:predicted MFS family arabinose efflux permease
MPLLYVLCTAAFVSAFSIRILDPLVPSIARDLGVAIGAAAMLAPAYTFPYAFSQPFLGSFGDQFGKERIIKICTAVLAVALLAAAFAPTYWLMFATRCISGIGGGGMIPIAFAIIGDRFPVAERQVALARMVMASQVAILLSASLSGLIAARFDWRLVFVLAALVAALSLVLLVRSLPATPPSAATRTFSLAAMKAQYAGILRSPMARYVLPAAMIEGMTLFGLLPFVAHRLEVRHMGGLQEAGLVIAGMSVGGIAFTAMVGPLLRWLGRAGLIRAGGLIAFAALLALANAQSWIAEAVCFAGLGFGFFMIHNSLQLLATELDPHARASSIALFACSFFCGQAIGPLIYHAGFEVLGLQAPLVIAAGLLLAMALGLGAVLDRKAAQS